MANAEKPIIEHYAKEQPELLCRLEPLLVWADEKLGPTDPDFDMKAFCDEMWGDD